MLANLTRTGDRDIPIKLFNSAYDSLANEFKTDFCEATDEKYQRYRKSKVFARLTKKIVHFKLL